MREILFFIGAGVGLGWLVGLSASEVVDTVLASLLSLVVGITAISSGFRNEGNLFSKLSEIKLGVIFALTIGVAMGATAGAAVRLNHYLILDDIYREKLKFAELKDLESRGRSGIFSMSSSKLSECEIMESSDDVDFINLVNSAESLSDTQKEILIELFKMDYEKAIDALGEFCR